MDGLTIRNSTQADLAGIEAMYPLAFPGEDLLPLVRSLLTDTGAVVSLVAEINAEIVGNIIFTRGQVGDTPVGLLAPLAVTPARHQQGLGSQLIRDGLRAMRETGVDIVCVLGDPAYYGRFGFTAEGNIKPPYTLPDEWRSAWQSLCLDDSARAASGQLELPAQWLHPELWLP